MVIARTFKTHSESLQGFFLLKGHYHRYTLNEVHQNGLEFCDHLDLQDHQADGAEAIQYNLISKALYIES